MPVLSKARRMSLLDASFLQIETRETPMHVAGLQVFKLPKNAPEDFIKNVVLKLRSPESIARPWNLKLAPVAFSRLAPAMLETDDIDMGYHVRHTCLPSPGGERELGELVSHLHSTTLDRSRPLWTCHVIEGLENNRFALYTKIHHALTDGVKGMQMLTRCLGHKAKDSNWSVPWSAKKHPTLRSPKQKQAITRDDPPLLAWPRVVGDALKPLIHRNTQPEPIRVPFEAPNSILNGPVTGARRVATQRFDLKRVKAVAKHHGVSVNDVFLAVCSSALRRHLMDSDNLPDRSLIAGVPVSLRTDSSNADAGNAIGFIWVNLTTDLADPVKRLRAIHKSTQASKKHLQHMPSKARNAYTTLAMVPVISVLLSGQGARTKPAMNVVISNVPGPQQALYLGRAKLEAIYPISIPIQGLGLNITCVSYDGQLTVGFTGTRDGVPHLQRIAVYAGEALSELEASMLKKPA